MDSPDKIELPKQALPEKSDIRPPWEFADSADKTHILMQEVALNPFAHTDVSYTPEVETDLMRLFNEHGITPETHPKAVDLYAGDGSLAKILVKNGWQEENMTCIDMSRSHSPLVRKANWLFWNLDSLDEALQSGVKIPTEVSQTSGQFDISLIYATPMSKEGLETIGNFFTKRGGYIVHNGKIHPYPIPPTTESVEQPLWRKLLNKIPARK